MFGLNGGELIGIAPQFISQQSIAHRPLDVHDVELNAIRGEPQLRELEDAAGNRIRGAVEQRAASRSQTRQEQQGLQKGVAAG
jgi:hypothetical protein